MPRLFTFIEGQIVRLAYQDKPGEAHTITKAPTEFLREFIAWNDRGNGDYEETTRWGLLYLLAEVLADNIKQYPEEQYGCNAQVDLQNMLCEIATIMLDEKELKEREVWGLRATVDELTDDTMRLLEVAVAEWDEADYYIRQRG